MKKKKLLTMIGSVCLILVLAALLLPACAKEVTPPIGEEAQLKAQITDLQSEMVGLEKKLATALEPAKVYKFKLQFFVTREQSHGVAYTNFYEPYIKEATNGRVELEFFPPGALVATADIPDAIDRGLLDMGYTSAGYYRGAMGPVADFLSGAVFQWESEAEYELLLYDLGIGDIAREAYAKLGCYEIGFIIGSKLPLMTKHPISSLEDLKGLKIRTYGMQAALLEKLGVSTVYIVPEEVYTAVATGVIDGFTIGDEAQVLSWGMPEVCKGWVVPAFHRTDTDLLIQPGLWEELPDNLKRIMADGCRIWSVGHQTYLVSTSSEGLKTMIDDYDVSVYYVTDEELASVRDLGMEVWEETAGDDPIALKAKKIGIDFLMSMGRIK